jgi:hypothetical protein
LDAETRGDVKRWASIDSVARRVGIEYEEAEALAAELEVAGLLWVRVHSIWLTQEGRRQLIASGRKSATGATKARKGRR